MESTQTTYPMYLMINPPDLEIIKEKYIVLELEEIVTLEGPKTVYAVVNLPMDNLTKIDFLKIEPWRRLHDHLITNYKKKDYAQAKQALDNLVGAWDGNLDLFYNRLAKTMGSYSELQEVDTIE